MPAFDGFTGLDFFVPDPLLEALWAREQFSRVLPAELGVDFAIAPDFSVYWSDPRREQEHAIARSLQTCDRWTRAGVPMIPVVAWARDVHRELIGGFVRAGGYRAIALNFQMLHPRNRGRVLGEARALLEELDIDSVLICGGTSAAMRDESIAALPDWTVAFTNSLWFFDSDRELVGASARGGR